MEAVARGVHAAGHHDAARPRPPRPLGAAARHRHGDPARRRARATASARRRRRICSSRSTCCWTASAAGTSSARGCARRAPALGHVRRPEGALRGRPDGRRALVRPAAAAPRAPRSATRSCLEAAWFLASPPFALARAVADRSAAALAALAGGWMVAAVFGAALLAARAGPRHRADPGAAPGCARGSRCWPRPWYIAWKAVVQLRALASVLRRDEYYGPTARA